MNDDLKQLCEAFLQGHVGERGFLETCLRTVSRETSQAQVDLDREARCGFPEVIFAEGKTVEALLEIVRVLRERGQAVLATRVSAVQRAALVEAFPAGVLHEAGKTFRLPRPDERPEASCGRVAVITAGTGDLPVAYEAMETLAWMGVATTLITDVGVAGPHRFPAKLELLRGIDAAIVVAGMEGALPSVAGGYLNCPVIGVPTSVGYGVSLGGVAALLSMLNSCAANVMVVNVDAGFKAAYCAGLIATRGRRPGTPHA